MQSLSTVKQFRQDFLLLTHQSPPLTYSIRVECFISRLFGNSSETMYGIKTRYCELTAVNKITQFVLVNYLSTLDLFPVCSRLSKHVVLACLVLKYYLSDSLLSLSWLCKFEVICGYYKGFRIAIGKKNCCFEVMGKKGAADPFIEI